MRGFDAVVLGGGPAGCATALFAARRGLRVALLERDAFPRPKACGEGLMPAGVAVLKELGLEAQAASLGRPFAGVRYTSRAGRTAEGRFPGGARGLGVPRESFDAMLWRAASRAAGVTAVERCEDASSYAAPLKAVCDGGRSRAAEALGVLRRTPARRRFGLSARFAGVRGDEVVRVYLADGAELYLTPLPDGQALVAALFEERALDRPEAAYERLIASCPAAAQALAGARRCSPLRGLGPLGQRAERVCGEDWLLAGDAAGALDPIIGDGMAAALQTGRLAGLALARAAVGERGALESYARKRTALLRGRRWLASAVLAASALPAAAEGLVAALGRFPPAFDAVLSLF